MRNHFPVDKFKFLLIAFFISGISLPAVSGISLPALANANQSADSVSTTPRTFEAEEIIRGERLFYGLVYLEGSSVNCAGCHNTRVSDTLNWNPDALEISLKYLNKTDSDLSKVLLTPTGLKMAQVHKGFQLTPEDITLIKAYMDELVVIGLKKNKPVITNLFLFVTAFILVLLSLTDLIITKRLKHRWIHAVILLSAGIYISYTLYVEAVAIGRSQNYSPTQPVKFSHAVHAGQNQTDCIYCHSSVQSSKIAGIPPQNVCMNCHLMVRNGTRSGTAEIAKVISAYENSEPVKWIKVHNLPDHVFFSHAQHVTVGGVSCEECHGKVQERDEIVQVSDLSMGWCLNCHQTRKVNFSENKFYQDYKDLAEAMKNGTLDSVTVEMTGGRECMKCHY